MIDWVCQKLREDEEKLFTPLTNALSDPDYSFSKELAIQEARRGNIDLLLEKLREKDLSEFAPFLTPPPSREQKTDLSRGDDIEWVAFDVRRIRTLWRNYYDKKRRNKTDGASAYEIAVVYFESHPMGTRGDKDRVPTLDDVEARLKPSGPSGKKRPNKLI